MASAEGRGSLGDYFTLQRGTTYKSKLLGQPGPLLLGLATIQRNGGFRTDSLQTYGGGSPDKLLVRPGELYVSLKDVTQSADLLGAIARLPRSYPPGRLTQDTVKLEPKGSDVPLDYLYWLLRTPQYRRYCRAHATGTTNLGLAREDFLAFPALEPRPGQVAIVKALNGLDDKIELNRRMNETLEAISRSLFKAWFEKVSPSRAKADDLIRDGVLEIGDGYRAKNSELGTPGLPFIRAGDLSDGIDTSEAEVLRLASVAKAGAKVSRAGDVAFTSKGTIGRFARVTDDTEPCVYSPQVCFWRSLDRQKLHPAVLYCWMQSDDFMSQVQAVAGQTDMAPYVSLRDQRRMEVPLFPESQLAVGVQIERLLARQALAATESKCLGALRDTLLPKLISGELRLKDAGRFVERTEA